MSTFTLTDKQTKKFDKWAKKIKRKYPEDTKEVFTFCFTPNGIGVGQKVKHSASGEELDLTDVSDW